NNMPRSSASGSRYIRPRARSSSSSAISTQKACSPSAVTMVSGSSGSPRESVGAPEAQAARPARAAVSRVRRNNDMGSLSGASVARLNFSDHQPLGAFGEPDLNRVSRLKILQPAAAQRLDMDEDI